MHWFDRIATRIAEAPEAPATRRGIFKGAALAAVASPFASHAVAYGSNRVKAHAAQSACQDCLANVVRLAQIQFEACTAVGKGPWKYGDGPIIFNGKTYATDAKKKKKKKKKTRPWEAPGDTACMANARINFYFGNEKCRTQDCAPQAPPPDPGSGCAPGTAACGQSLCCFGNDNCCTCIHSDPPGPTCCVAEIGCTCCPQGS